MEIEMDRRLIIKIDFVAPRAFGRRDIRIERLDILGSRALACDAHRDRFNQHTRLGQMLGRNRAEMEHVAQAGDDGVAGALAHECAAAGALLQAQQAGVFQRPQRLAQGVARYSELLGQQALGGQSIAGPQAPIGQLDPNLLGDFFECARSLDRAEFDPVTRARFGANFTAMRRGNPRGVLALDIGLSHMLHWFNH